MTPAQYKRWVNGADAWGRYQTLLQDAAASLEAKIAAYLERMDATALGGLDYRTFRQQMLFEIQRETAMLENALQGSTSGIMESLERQQYEAIAGGFGRHPELLGSFARFSSQQGLIISRAEIDIGKLIKLHVKTFQAKLNGNLGSLLRDAEKRIRIGELTGMPVQEIITDLRQNVVGLRPYQRAAGVTADLRRVVRTQASAVNCDVMRAFGRSEPSIIGEKIQRGPGPCPTDICGAGLGLSEGEIGIFIYGVNDPPLIPLHPNSYAAVVGYVFQNNAAAIEQAKLFYKNKLQHRELYQAVSGTGSHKKVYEEVAAHLKQHRAGRGKRAA